MHAVTIRRTIVWRGYGAAVLGVGAASLCIAGVQLFVHFSNISLFYLPVVLWLAAKYGRGPAILASVLAFLAYDFFFIPPLYLFTVDDPTEWISLLSLLATSLVLGQLTAVVQQRAREAHESQQRTAILYALSQRIVSTSEPQALLDALAQRVVEVFAPLGVQACALLLPVGSDDGQERLAPEAVYPVDTPWRGILATQRDDASAASDALQSAASSIEQTAVTAFSLPLYSGKRMVGVLSVAGSEAITALLSPHGADRTDPRTGLHELHSPVTDAQRDLFAGFRDQIALALDRLELGREAIHAAALRESDKLKDALLGSVTHDLRTPLASIRAATESLLDADVTWTEEQRHYFLETIESSAVRLNRLVTNLLDLSRLEAGVAVPEKQWYPLSDVIATVLDRLDLIGLTAGRTIEVEEPPDLPLVPLDHEQMEQVMTNLIENAIKYSPPRSVIRISVGVTGDHELGVRVSDQGIGIPQEELTAIFDKFYRVQAPRQPGQPRQPVGTGLGLAIVAAIIRAHGGRIWAESTPGQGAIFIFRLPIPDTQEVSALLEADVKGATVKSA